MAWCRRYDNLCNEPISRHIAPNLQNRPPGLDEPESDCVLNGILTIRIVSEARSLISMSTSQKTSREKRNEEQKNDYKRFCYTEEDL
ncbi:unnamed protein product, partial [Nesidiocoris tenuis]